MRKDWLRGLALMLPVLTGCLSHTRKLQQPKIAGPVMNADALTLVNQTNQRYDQLQSFTATMDFAVSVGGARQGKQTDYTSFLGYILFRKPQMLRVLILVPVLHTHAVDLASNGNAFTLLIPPKNRAIEGKNSVTRPSKNPLENLRPNVFIDALLVHRISPNQIVSVIHESETTLNHKTKQLTELPEYDLTVLTAPHSGSPPAVAEVANPLRVIRFSRLNLLPLEQDSYNSSGDLEMQVQYGPYRDFSGFQFPSTIDINRPLDGYRIRLTVDKLILNPPLSDEQFQLKVPKGTQVQKLE